MAVAVNVDGEKVARTELHILDPFKIIMIEEGRGRDGPPKEEEIIARAVSMMKHGQLEAIECRRDHEKRPVVNYGYTRTAAGRLIRTGFDYTDENGVTTHYHNPEFKLNVKIFDCNAEEAFLRNIVENIQRLGTTPIEDAKNQRKLKDQYGYTDAHIASIYQYKNTNKIIKLRKLLTLDSVIQQKVHNNELTMSAALELCDLPEEQRAAVLEQVAVTGPVSGSAIRSQVRDTMLRDNPNAEVAEGEIEDGEESQENEAPKSRSRSMREVRKFFEGLKEAEEDPAIQRFCKDVLSWVGGKKTDTALINAVERLLDARRSRSAA